MQQGRVAIGVICWLAIFIGLLLVAASQTDCGPLKLLQCTAAVKGCNALRNKTEEEHDDSFYKQYWLEVQYRAAYCASDVDRRKTAIALPTRHTMPKDGWPTVLYLMFMNKQGQTEGWKVVERGGIRPYRTLLTLTGSRRSLQRMLRGFLQRGFAVVMTSEEQHDSYFYKPCSEAQRSDCNNICWNDGDNPDNAYFRALFSTLNSSMHKFDFNRFAVFGYSVGAQMASRIMNDFPSMQGYPVIKAAVMLAGGSFALLRCDE